MEVDLKGSKGLKTMADKSMIILVKTFGHSTLYTKQSKFNKSPQSCYTNEHENCIYLCLYSSNNAFLFIDGGLTSFFLHI